MTDALWLDWIQWSTTNERLRLHGVNLTPVTTFGVYVIWHGGAVPRVVRVGQGVVADRLTSHRKDAAVLSYEQSGILYVTWAAVPARLVDGVERYLAERLRPLVGDRFPQVAPVPVNSPFAA